MKTTKGNSQLFLEGFLGLFNTFGPFVMDMYLSSFPQIVDYYHTVPSLVQLSLATCTIGLAIGQFLFGIVSDRFGRRVPLLLSLLLFLSVTAVCVVSPSIELFVGMRFFQGLAAAGGVVISRSVAADCYSGSALARMYGIIGMINGISTILAPMIGGFVAGAWGWRAIFVTLFGIAVVMLLGTLHLRESQPKENRISLNPMALLHDTEGILRNQKYAVPTMQYGFIMALIFVNLASGPFIMDDYGLSTEAISLTFGVNAIPFIIAAGLIPRFTDLHKLVRFSNVGMAMASLVLSVILLTHFPFIAYEMALFTLYLFIGFMCSATTALAMDAERTKAGIASAFLGATGYVAGAVVSPIVGLGDVFSTSALLFVGLAFSNWILSCCFSQRHIRSRHNDNVK